MAERFARPSQLLPCDKKIQDIDRYIKFCIEKMCHININEQMFLKENIYQKNKSLCYLAVSLEKWRASAARNKCAIQNLVSRESTNP